MLNYAVAFSKVVSIIHKVLNYWQFVSDMLIMSQML